MENSMKVVFLDIDGVLNSVAYDRIRTVEQGNVDETRLPLLKQIVDETGALIVLSSSWRHKFEDDLSPREETGQTLLNLFAQYHLSIYGKTPVSPTNDRAREIRAWLSQHPETQAYVIIDDIPFGWGADLQEHLVRTDARIGRGLEARHIGRIVELLKG